MTSKRKVLVFPGTEIIRDLQVSYLSKEIELQVQDMDQIQENSHPTITLYQILVTAHGSLD